MNKPRRKKLKFIYPHEKWEKTVSELHNDGNLEWQEMTFTIPVDEVDVPLEIWKYRIFKYKNGLVSRTENSRVCWFYHTFESGKTTLIHRMTKLIENSDKISSGIRDEGWDVLRETSKYILIEKSTQWDMNSFIERMPEIVEHLVKIGKELKQKEG